MKYWLAFLLSILFSSQLFAKEEATFKYHSYSEFLNLIQQEEDSIFEYADAIIQFNPATDQRFKIYYQKDDSVWTSQAVDTIKIDKRLYLSNVHFISNFPEPDTLNGKLLTSISGVWYKIRFNGILDFQKCSSIGIYNSRINNHLRIINEEYKIPIEIESFQNLNTLEFKNNLILNDFSLVSTSVEKYNKSCITIKSNKFRIDKYVGNWTFSTSIDKAQRVFIDNNYFDNIAPNYINIQSGQWVQFQDNTFKNYTELQLYEFYGLNRLQFRRNIFENFVFFNIALEIPITGNIGWQQLKGSLISDTGFGPYISRLFSTDLAYMTENRFKHAFMLQYYDSVRIEDPVSFLGEMSMRGRLYNHFKAKYDNDQANAVFIDLKDLETARLGYQYKQDPTFRTYFKWKINQFLRFFVDYGTDPAKAIVISVYVILLFALIYLFFPNTWDAQGRTRIMNRYRFFLKYLNRKEGVHEVYMEEKEKELVPFHEFRDYLNQHVKTVPRFFYATALPLYKWSISGVKFSSWLLSKTDVLKGTWADIPKKGRWLKTSLVICAFLIALTYDMLIKILNAVMLSINTFTTLGFGEIPIKGLPRYLAIIQGFVGWFMLTIFSVSLISQLLK